MNEKPKIQLMRIFIALLILVASNVLLYLNQNILEIFNIKIPFGKIVIFEFVFGLLFGFLSVVVSIFVEFIYNGIWLRWISK